MNPREVMVSPTRITHDAGIRRLSLSGRCRSGRPLDLVVPLFGLTACGVGTASVSDSDLNACLIETRAPGQYTLSQTEIANSGAPAVFPAAGGTQAGAGMIQNCLARKANDGVKAKDTPNTGGLPLPVNYPLLPGDAELWPTLTRAQQERALAFLADGSTISASLKGDQ